MTERLVSGAVQAGDLDQSLRPRRLDDFVGQAHVKNNLDISIRAAKMRGDPLDHIIIYGPPGLGKTTLAHIIAQEMESDIRVTSGPAIERAGDMAAILTALQPDDILFIDEIHRLHRTVEEVWYVLEGHGQVWRCPPDADPKSVPPSPVAPDDALVIPTGWSFQFSADASEALRFLCVTIPSWPGENEAAPVPEGGLGPPTV